MSTDVNGSRALARLSWSSHRPEIIKAELIMTCTDRFTPITAILSSAGSAIALHVYMLVHLYLVITVIPIRSVIYIAVHCK